jgi:hypothetical protein
VKKNSDRIHRIDPDEVRLHPVHPVNPVRNMLSEFAESRWTLQTTIEELRIQSLASCAGMHHPFASSQ